MICGSNQQVGEGMDEVLEGSKGRGGGLGLIGGGLRKGAGCWAGDVGVDIRGGELMGWFIGALVGVLISVLLGVGVVIITMLITIMQVVRQIILLFLNTYVNYPHLPLLLPDPQSTLTPTT